MLKKDYQSCDELSLVNESENNNEYFNSLEVQPDNTPQ